MDSIKEAGRSRGHDRAGRVARSGGRTSGGAIAHQVMDAAAKLYRAELKRTPKGERVFQGRGVTGEIAKRFGLGYAPDDWQGLKAAFDDYSISALVECGLVIDKDGKRYDRFRDRVMFPIRTIAATSSALVGACWARRTEVFELARNAAVRKGRRTLAFFRAPRDPRYANRHRR